MKLTLKVCLAMFGLSAFAADAPAPSTAEKEVMQVTQDACRAFLEADVAAAEALLAPEFTLVNSRAVVQSRDEVMTEIRARDPVYSEFRNHSMNAHVFGDAAIVQGITTVKGKSGATPFDVNVRFTDTLVRRQGKWRLVVSHVTGIPR
jgi:ketosteroid isomerase-like protein